MSNILSNVPLIATPPPTPVAQGFITPSTLACMIPLSSVVKDNVRKTLAVSRMTASSRILARMERVALMHKQLASYDCFMIPTHRPALTAHTPLPKKVARHVMIFILQY